MSGIILPPGGQVDRSTYCGGSDAAAICGKSEWRTPLDVFLEKTGKAAPRLASERMLWGTLLEPVILAEAATRKALYIEPGGFKVAKGEPWRGGHADAIASGPDLEPLALMEAKAVNKLALPEWRKGIPIDYQYQAQHYLAIYELDLCIFPVLFGGQELVLFDLEADPIVQHEIQTCCKAFWYDNVLADKPPAGASIEHAGALFGTREATVTEKLWLGQLAVLRKVGNIAESKVDALQQQLRDTAAEATLTVNGLVVGEWKDWERKAYTVKAQSGRSFTVPRYNVLAKRLGLSLDELDDAARDDRALIQ